MNLFLLASGSPFEHTWDSWVIEFYGTHIDLRDAPGFEALGITKAVVMLLVAAGLLVVAGTLAGTEARRATAEGRPARGFGAAVETVVDFIRSTMMRPNMPHHYDRPWLVAFFCTLFFFVLFTNLLGLLPPPFGFTATGVPWVPCGLAFGASLIAIVVSGVKEHGAAGYLVHLAPPAPWWIRWPLLLPIEIVGVFVKPFALTIRLTANMMAGHIILAVLMGFLLTSLSFVLQAIVWPAAAAGFGAITVFELVIAFIQAYIFTILSIVFVGQSVSHEH